MFFAGTDVGTMKGRPGKRLMWESGFQPCYAWHVLQVAPYSIDV